MIIINFVETITHRHRENMAKLDFFDQSKFKSERNQLQYFVNPIYFINLLILLQSLLKLKIPIIYSFTQQVLTVLSSNIALYFHMFLFTILLLGLMLPQQFKQFSFLLRLVFKNYDRVFLIPLQIISFNQMNQTNQIINSIAIYILCVNQVSFFSPLHFLSSNLNRTNTKLALLKPLVIQQIIIYTQLQVIHQYLGYFLLLYLLCVLLEIITERISYYNYLATNDCYLYTTAICILLIDFIPNQNDQLYVFCVILTVKQYYYSQFSLNVVHIIVLRIEYIIATRPNTVSFLQILYITHTKQALDAEKTLQFLILKEIHYFNCMDIKCICKRKNLLFEQDLHQVLNAQIVRLLKAERIKMNYIFFLFDITKNMVKGLQFILSQKSQILTTFYIVVLQIIQEQIQHNLIEETIKGKNPFMDEIKSLKLDGPILQKVTSQVYDAKVQLYEKIINRQIINFQQFFNEILHLQTQVLTLMDVCQQLMIWHNKQVHNIFSLRICLLVANIIQDLKEKASIQSFINDLIQQEVYKQDSFTNIAFTSNNAISLSANLDKWAEFTHPITGRQLKFLELERAPQSITQLLHPNFQGPHQKLIEAYLRKGKSTIIGNQLDTTFSPNQNSLIPVKMVLYPYFPKMRLDSYQLIAYLSKIEYINHGIIHLDLNFSIQCVNRGFVKFLETYHLTPNRINIFQMIPSLKDTFVQFHQQEMKTLYMQNQTIQIQQISVGGDSIKSKSMSLSKKFDRGAQMSYLETFRYMTITSNQLEESQQIDYELSFHQIKYETDEGDEYYIYYKLVIDLGQLGDEQQEDGKANTSNNKRFKKTPNSDQNKDLLRSLHSKASTSSSEKIGDDLLRQISNSSVPPSLRFFIIVSFIAVSFAIASLLIIYFLLLQKRSQQDVCFDRLFYGTEFLDYYALILKGSRHTVFYRDFNKYVPNQQTIDVADYDVTIAEKISLSLLLYQNNCKELIQLYENYLSYLNSYQDQKEINFKYVDYYVTKVQIQIVETQAKYYEIMNQLFYLALKTFAGDPSAYLKGNLDSFAQINTRSILFLNFNDVCDLTQQFIESCLFNSQQYNNTFDGQVQIAFYIMHFVAVSLFAMLLLSIKATIKRMKQIIQIFLRMDNRDIEEDKEMLLYVLKNIKDEEFWFNSKFFVQFFEKSQDYQHKKDFAEKIVNLKLDDAFNLPLYYVLQSFIYILMFIFFLQFQLQYNNYSNEINPIVNQALSAVQIRLNFVKIVSNWDVYNYQTFYKSFHDQDFMTKNIQHDTLIYSLIKINYTELSQSIVSALQEPFSDMTNGLSDELRDQLLIKDICLLMNCTLEKEIFQDRLLQNELSANFKIGLIQLYKQTIQVIENLGLMEVNSSNSEEFLYTFLNSVYSKEYFLYIFWGLDATNYELKLFSDYFISIAKDKLTSQTQNIISILFGVGLTIIIIIMGITIVLGYKIFICYNSLKYCLRFIPFKTMLNKNIIKQIKMII